MAAPWKAFNLKKKAKYLGQNLFPSKGKGIQHTRALTVVERHVATSQFTKGNEGSILI